MVVFLTDGLPTAGITDETLIARLGAETGFDPIMGNPDWDRIVERVRQNSR